MTTAISTLEFSAGVGRTGTFIAIESSLRQIEHDQTVDVYGTVCRMRMQRNFMVQIEVSHYCWFNFPSL